LPHLADAQTQIESKRPQLVLLDNYLPDGKGITLIDNAMLARTHCSVIFITAASDMDTCSLAISQRRIRLHPQAGIVEASEPVA
jgi:two-component system response regulator CitB